MSDDEQLDSLVTVLLTEHEARGLAFAVNLAMECLCAAGDDMEDVEERPIIRAQDKLRFSLIEAGCVPE